MMKDYDDHNLVTDQKKVIENSKFTEKHGNKIQFKPAKIEKVRINPIMQQMKFEKQVVEDIGLMADKTFRKVYDEELYEKKIDKLKNK